MDKIGLRQKAFLELLLRYKDGLTVDDFSQQLGITHTAVRQHLATLGSGQYVIKSVTKPSGGRPRQIYVLTDKGNEVFPRQYSWFAQLLLEIIEQDVGAEGVNDRLAATGKRIAEKLCGDDHAQQSVPLKIEKLTDIMTGLGYNARTLPMLKGIPIIEANNCVFHDLAKKHPVICQFDLSLLSTFTGSKVVHEECMAKDDHVCRFRFEENEK